MSVLQPTFCSYFMTLLCSNLTPIETPPCPGVEIKIGSCGDAQLAWRLSGTDQLAARSAGFPACIKSQCAPNMTEACRGYVPLSRPCIDGAARDPQSQGPWSWRLHRTATGSYAPPVHRSDLRGRVGLRAPPTGLALNAARPGSRASRNGAAMGDVRGPWTDGGADSSAPCLTAAAGLTVAGAREIAAGSVLDPWSLQVICARA